MMLAFKITDSVGRDIEDKKAGKEVLIIESGDHRVKDEKRKHEEKSLSKDQNGQIELIVLLMFLVAANSTAKAHPSSLTQVVL